MLPWKQQIAHIFNDTFKSLTMLIFYVIVPKVTLLEVTWLGFVVLLVTYYQVQQPEKDFLLLW